MSAEPECGNCPAQKKSRALRQITVLPINSVKAVMKKSCKGEKGMPKMKAASRTADPPPCSFSLDFVPLGLRFINRSVPC